MSTGAMAAGESCPSAADGDMTVAGLGMFVN
jgi:hypothetical protein